MGSSVLGGERPEVVNTVYVFRTGGGGQFNSEGAFRSPFWLNSSAISSKLVFTKITDFQIFDSCLSLS